LEELEMENQELKQTVDLLTQKIVQLEQTHQENHMLKSSIIQFRQDIQKQVIQLIENVESSKSTIICINTTIKCPTSTSPTSKH
jgi:hypothetical protein